MSAKSTLKRILRKNKVCLCEREGYGGKEATWLLVVKRRGWHGDMERSDFHGESESTGGRGQDVGTSQAEPDEERKTNCNDSLTMNKSIKNFSSCYNYQF